MSIDISALNILDYAIIIILVVSAILSTLRGMTREALGLVGWPIAIFAAKYSAPVIEPMIVSVIKVGGIGQALSWALPFAVVVVLWFVIARHLIWTLRTRPAIWPNPHVTQPVKQWLIRQKMRLVRWQMRQQPISTF